MVRKNLKKLTFAAIVTLAILGCTEASAAIVTTTYEFLTDQSIMEIFGWHGWSRPYPIEGQFQLTIDYDTSTASFNWVVTSDIWGDSVGDIFYMTELEGTVVSESQIEFLSESTNPTFPGRDILLVFTFIDDAVYLTSSTFYPRYAMDAPFYALNAVAVPEPTSILMLAFGGLLLRHNFSLSQGSFVV